MSQKVILSATKLQSTYMTFRSIISHNNPYILQRWSVGLFTLPQNFKKILDEAPAEKTSEEAKDKRGEVVEDQGIKVICVGLSR